MINIIFCVGAVFCCVTSIVLSILYIRAGRRLAKKKATIIESNKIVDIGTSLDDREVYECEIEFK